MSAIETEHTFLLSSIRYGLMKNKKLLVNYPYQGIILKIHDSECVKVTTVKATKDLPPSRVIVNDEEVQRFLEDFQKKLKHFKGFTSGYIRIFFTTIKGKYLYSSFTVAKEIHLHLDSFLRAQSRTLENDLDLFKEDMKKALKNAITRYFRDDIGTRKESTIILHTRNCVPQRVIWSVSVNDEPRYAANANINVSLDNEEIDNFYELIQMRIREYNPSHIGSIIVRFSYDSEKRCFYVRTSCVNDLHIYGENDLSPVGKQILGTF